MFLMTCCARELSCSCILLREYYCNHGWLLIRGAPHQNCLALSLSGWNQHQPVLGISYVLYVMVPMLLGIQFAHLVCCYMCASEKNFVLYIICISYVHITAPEYMNLEKRVRKVAFLAHLEGATCLIMFCHTCCYQDLCSLENTS